VMGYQMTVCRFDMSARWLVAVEKETTGFFMSYLEFGLF
jgi:hypothetical protein